MGDYDDFAERAALVGDAGRFVGGRADDREVQAFRQADVAEQHAAGVQADAEAERGRGLRGALGVDFGQAHARHAPGRERGAAGGGRAAEFVERKNGENAVADVAEDFAARGLHRAGRAFEETVQQFQKHRLRQLLGQARGGAQVGEPNHRVDVLAVAALNLAREDAPPGVGAEIRRHHILGQPLAHGQAEHHRQARLQAAQVGHLRRVPAARRIGTPSHKHAVLLVGIGVADRPARVAERRAHGEVVGDALGRQLREHRIRQALAGRGAQAVFADVVLQHVAQRALPPSVGPLAAVLEAPGVRALTAHPSDRGGRV